MIKIHRDNRVVFWLLIGGLVLNILWSLRLELQAKAITRVEKYHLNPSPMNIYLYSSTYQLINFSVAPYRIRTFILAGG